MNIVYQVNRRISPEQFVDVLRRSTLSERRPIDDDACIAGMLDHANLTITAWDGEVLVGVARSVTDFHFDCYLSDLAVDSRYQGTGIGGELVRRTHGELGPRCTLRLVSAPAALGYYPKLGFVPNTRSWEFPPSGGEARPAPRFRGPVVNLYVQDVEGLASFYSEHFGFVESFRTPKEGTPVQVELRLATFTLGLVSVEAATSMHGLPLDPGGSRSEVALRTDDVDEVVRELRGKGVRVISEPHTFGGSVRAAWLLDPEGNHVQVVGRVPAA